MLLDKFAKFIETLTYWLGVLLPADIVLWLGALVVCIFVLAVWRMVH